MKGFKHLLKCCVKVKREYQTEGVPDRGRSRQREEQTEGVPDGGRSRRREHQREEHPAGLRDRGVL